MKSKLKHSKEFDRIVHCQTLDGVDSTSSPDKRKLLGRHIEGKIRSKTSHHVNEQPSEETQRQYGAIWAIKFSRDGRYMAAGGQNCIIKVWEVLDTESNQKPQMDDVERKPPDQEETIKVFKDKAIREYHGHMADILDLCWSKVRDWMDGFLSQFLQEVSDSITFYCLVPWTSACGESMVLCLESRRLS